MPASLPAELTPQLSDALAVLEQHLGDSLEAVHVFGSALQGGLKPHSDLDLMVTVNRPLAPAVRLPLMRELLAASAWPGTHATRRALEVTVLNRDDVLPWRYPARRELQFGEWLRADIEAGVVEPPVVDIDLAVLLTTLRAHSVALKGPSAAELFHPVPLADLRRALAETLPMWNGPADWDGDQRNVVLTIARIWYTAATGAIVPKDVAAEWVAQRLPPVLAPLLQQARLAYRGEGVDDLKNRPDQIAAFVPHAKAAIQALLARD
jgi:streptomycin 3"-adenylyltransferase